MKFLIGFLSILTVIVLLWNPIPREVYTASLQALPPCEADERPMWEFRTWGGSGTNPDDYEAWIHVPCTPRDEMYERLHSTEQSPPWVWEVVYGAEIFEMLVGPVRDSTLVVIYLGDSIVGAYKKFPNGTAINRKGEIQ